MVDRRFARTRVSMMYGIRVSSGPVTNASAMRSTTFVLTCLVAHGLAQSNPSPPPLSPEFRQHHHSHLRHLRRFGCGQTMMGITRGSSPS